MARTLVGRLQLVVEAMGLGEAKKVEGAMSSIERAAKRLSAEPWGQNFHRQIEKMALDAGKLDQVRRSWDNLQKDMSSRGLTAALKKSEIAAWKTATVGHFAAVQAQAKRANEQMDRTVGLMRRLGRVGLAAGGIYGGVYGASMVGREAFRAASEGQRTKYRFQVAGISKADTDALDAESTRLAGKYGVISKNDILELGKTSYALFGGRTDLAKQVLEAVVQNFVADFTSSGEEFAGNNMSSFLKAMDNLNKNEGADGGVGNIAAILNGWTKAKQVEGKDIEIGEILSFAQRATAQASVAQHALSHFLATAPTPTVSKPPLVAPPAQIAPAPQPDEVQAIRGRFRAFGALEERAALPALHVYLRDETAIALDLAAKILKAAKEDMQALGLAQDPAAAYMTMRARAGALGLEWHPEYRASHDVSSTGTGGAAAWDRAMAQANAGFNR